MAEPALLFFARKKIEPFFWAFVLLLWLFEWLVDFPSSVHSLQIGGQLEMLSVYCPILPAVAHSLAAVVVKAKALAMALCLAGHLSVLTEVECLNSVDLDWQNGDR